MTHARSLRTISAFVGTASLVVLLSLSASPALAVEAPWTTPVEVADAYGNADATVVAPDGTITILSESALGVVAASSTDAGLTWGPTTLVSSSGNYAFRPAVGVTSSGLLAATWVEELNSVRSILVAVSADKGLTWTTQTLPTVSGELDDPVVASTSAIGFTIAWNEGFAKLSSTSTDGGVTWSPAQVITQDLNSYARASLVPTGAGEIVVIFQEFDGIASRYSIQSRLSTDGGATWGAKVPVGSDWSGNFGNSRYVYGVSPAAGTVVAAWTRGTAEGFTLFAATSTDGGATWAAPFAVGDPAESLRYFTGKAISPTAVGFLWHYETQDGATLSYSTVTVGADAATTPVILDASPDYVFDRLPAFSSLGDVRVASWFEYVDDEGTSGFSTSVSCDAGATWSAPAVLATGDDIAESDSQTTVSGETFAAYWGQDATGPSGRSLTASTLSDACGSVNPVIPAGPTLAATGVPIVPTGILALVIVALGAGFLVVRRRSVV